MVHSRLNTHSCPPARGGVPQGPLVVHLPQAYPREVVCPLWAPRGTPGLRTPSLFTCACAQYQPSADLVRHWGVPPGEPANKRNAAWLARYPPSYQVDCRCQRCDAYGENACFGRGLSPPLGQPWVMACSEKAASWGHVPLDCMLSPRAE